jgi:hypothetical protein
MLHINPRNVDITTSSAPDPCELAIVGGDELSQVAGGFDYWTGSKNALKTAVNGFVNYENAALPDQVGPGFASYNVPKIPKPFHDDPFKKDRDYEGRLLSKAAHAAWNQPGHGLP